MTRNKASYSRKSFALCILFLFFLLGCSMQKPISREILATNWLKDGAIMISRPAPEITQPSAQKMLAFLPTTARHEGTWLAIDREKQSLSLMEEDRTLASVSGDGIKNLKPGTYKVLHKQRNAPWHASKAYFVERDMPVPSKGDKSRYLRGALGEFAIFLSEDCPIHNGPIWTSDIGGVRLAESELSKIYYSLNIGAAIEVR